MNELDLLRLLRQSEIKSRREPFPPQEQKTDSPPSDSVPVPPDDNKFGYDTPPPMYHGRGRIISVLADCDGLTQKELSERLFIRPQSLSEALFKLEADGILYRERSETDKREIHCHLTDSGRERAAFIKQKRLEHAKEFFDALTEDEKNTLAAILTKLCTAYNENERCASKVPDNDIPG